MDKKQLIKLLSFFVMADGGVYRRSENGEAYFMMNMLTKHMDYIEWVKSTIEEVTSVTLSDVKDPCKQPQTRLCSRTHPTFSDLRDRIYIDSYKGLCPHAMKMLDWECLAIMYMADGSLYISPPNEGKGLVNPSPNVTLNMKRLSYGDHLFLKKRFKEEFDLEWNIGQGRTNGKRFYNLRLRNKDIDKFVNGVLPYMKESFHYKLYDSARKAPLGG